MKLERFRFISLEMFYINVNCEGNWERLWHIKPNTFCLSPLKNKCKTKRKDQRAKKFSEWERGLIFIFYYLSLHIFFIECKTNEIFSRTATSCRPTCQNMGTSEDIDTSYHHPSCGKPHEGCICKAGTIKMHS